MSVLLKVVGGIWAILGSANIVMMFRNDVLSSIGAVGILLNFVLFIFPGLVVYGIGAAIGRSRHPRMIEHCRQSTPTGTPSSVPSPVMTPQKQEFVIRRRALCN
jgi:hypothetical protein